MAVRVRFAPSPTGHVHIGNIRAAIFNWLFARHEGGQFLVRVEDTDRERSTPEAVRTVFGALDWLGLDHDEEPVYQSARMQDHLAAVERLVSAGHAYREDRGGMGECVVFRMPGEDMVFEDEIKGELRKAAADMQDFVIVRSNGTPVFHLANVVDDIAMGITHVIRGDDHIENTYRHVALYRALGCELPRFAHLPMIVNHQGKPYSKRDGAAYVGEFREQGYLPEALLNFLALLGWSPGEDREVLSRREMIELFDIRRVKSGPARMDMKKLEWMNGEYVRRMTPETYLDLFRQELEQAGLCDGSTDPEYLALVAAQMQERTKLLSDVAGAAIFFFTEEYAYDEKAVRKRLKKEGVPGLLTDMKQVFADLDPFSEETTEAALRALAEERDLQAAKLVHPVRVAVTGLPGGPGLFEILALLGRERVMKRIDRTLEMLGNA